VGEAVEREVDPERQDRRGSRSTKMLAKRNVARSMYLESIKPRRRAGPR